MGIAYHNNRKNDRWLKLFLICLIIVAIGVTGFFAYLSTIGPASLASAPAPTSTPAFTPASTSTSASNSISVFKPVSAPRAPDPKSQVPLNYNFGMSLGDTLPWLTQQQLDQELDDIASLGIGWIRIDMSWYDVQPNNSSTYHWTNLDRVIAAANARHLKVLPDVAYTPPWARPANCTTNDECAPANPELFAGFAADAVARYDTQGISDWEIWNEPNLGFWKPAPNVANYVALLKVTYVAIKSVEPSSTVITAGLAPAATAKSKGGAISPTDFLSQMYVDDAKPYFDAVGFHPYSFPALPTDYQSWSAWSQMANTNVNLRSIMIANGDAAKKIWLTEFGAPTGGPGLITATGTLRSWPGNTDHVTEALQAQMYATAITSVKQLSWAGPLFFYSYKDLGTSPSTSENFFGIVRFDGSDKPAYTTIKKLL